MTELWVSQFRSSHSLLLIKLLCSAQHCFGECLLLCQCGSRGTLTNILTKSTFSVKASSRRLKPYRSLYWWVVQQSTFCPLCEDCIIILFVVTKRSSTEGCTENNGIPITVWYYILYMRNTSMWELLGLVLCGWGGLKGPFVLRCAEGVKASHQQHTTSSKLVV